MKGREYRCQYLLSMDHWCQVPPAGLEGWGGTESEMAGTSGRCPPDQIREIEKEIVWEGDNLFLQSSLFSL